MCTRYNKLQKFSLIAIEIRASSDCCLYKLLGDLCTFAYNISPADVAVDQSLTMSYTEIISLLRKGHEAYVKRLAVAPSSEACYDLGCCTYLQAITMLYSRGQSSGVTPTKALVDDSISSLLSQASGYFANGIKKDPLSSDCWNGLALCVSEQEVCH